ncbi:MAG: hypothetical protein LBJ09_00560 [Clostridiales bacterium]|jgi:hypothetical protein|nr:hypothetical protein [Clostridiales bacterium]
MIYNDDNVIVCFCPECEEICIKEVYFFNFHTLKGKTIICENCKSVVVEIVVESMKKYKMRFLCCECGNIHETFLNPSIFWRSEIFIYKCQVTNGVSLITGEKNNVFKFVETLKETQDINTSSIENLLEERGENHVVFAEIVNVIREINKNNRIVCECENRDIILTLNKKNIKFLCEKCKNVKIIKVTKKELVKLKKDGKIHVKKIYL